MGETEAGGEAALSVVLTTLPDTDSAAALVRALVEERLIACGNIVPGLLSIYRWEGEIAREAEVLVVMKTVNGLLERLFQRVPELHPYDVPEVIQVPVEAVSGAYGRWVIERTRGGE